MAIAPCVGCPESWAAGPARIEHQGNGAWIRAADDAAVHLAALFRDPQVQDGRPIDVVLDLTADRTKCPDRRWLWQLRQALASLPTGLVAAIDNGVRCPCGVGQGPKAYAERVALCLEQTRTWLASLKHPNGGRPGVVLCDRTLTNTLAESGQLAMRDGTKWASPTRWLDAVGREITVLGHDGLVLAHPVVVQRIRAYRTVVSESVSLLGALARC
jgi:hypothetical protein